MRRKITRDDIIRGDYSNEDVLNLLIANEVMDLAIGDFQVATLRPGGADYKDENRLIEAWDRSKKVENA